MDAARLWLCVAVAAPSLQDLGIVKDGFVGMGASCCHSLLKDVHKDFFPSC